jgi:hypothetical protein
MRNSSVGTPSPIDEGAQDRADEGRSFMGIGVARKPRQTSTTPEVKLWQCLRNRRFKGEPLSCSINIVQTE